VQLAFTAHLPFRRPRLSPPAGGERTVALSRTHAARRASGCDDKAFYACSCGYAFTASVSTTVGCPNCGTAQAW
jgi:hypothetical protein